MVVPRNHWQQHSTPVFRTGVIATSEHDPFRVAKRIEHKQRVVAAALEVPRWRRPSLAFSNTIDEIDRLTVAVERLARGV